MSSADASFAEDPVSDLTLGDLCADLAGQIAELQEHGHPALVLPEQGDLGGTPLQAMVQTFGLTPFETGVLLLAAAMELETAAMLSSCALELNLSDRPMTAFLTPYALRRWLPGETRGDLKAFSPSGTLRQYGLIRLGPSPLGGGSDALSVVQITPGALAFLQGDWELSSEGRALLSPVTGGPRLAAGQQAALTEAEQVLQAAGTRGEWPPVLNLYGRSATTLLEVGQALGSAERPCWHLDLEAVTAQVRRDGSWQGVLSVLLRDLSLQGGVLLVSGEKLSPGGLGASGQTEAGGEGPEASAETVLAALCESAPAPVVVFSREPVRLRPARGLYALEVAEPRPEEQVQCWTEALGLFPSQAVVAALEELVTQFTLSATRIAELAQLLRRQLEVQAGAPARKGAKPPTPRPEQVLETLWQLCRQEGRKSFQGVAEHVSSRASWEQLVLPEHDLLTLQEIASQVRLRYRVYRAWGYEGQSRGLGITVLFSGVSGGGKTFAAEVLAGELNLDLYRVDLSKVSSKWVGETEKNLKQVFDAADEGGAVLLFDEADSIFGKRGEVQGGNDRYANLTTNYLLQRMEAYQGLAVLTTNFAGNIDPAFMRRIRFTLNFNKPDAAARSELWRRVFPAAVPTEGLDYALLARWEASGALIKAVALNASFMAELNRQPVTMDLVQEAIRRESRRQGRLSSTLFG